MTKNLFLNDKFILLLILLNSISIVLQGYTNENLSEAYFEYVDAIFTVLFAIEAWIKIKNKGWSSYIQDGWNKLDFILVILTIPSVFADFISVSDLGLSYLLTFRVLRVLKVVRFFRFVPNIEHLFKGIRNALKSSIVVFFGFFVYVFVVGILSNALFSEASFEDFGTPMRSFYTVFKLFTVEGWYEVPDSIDTARTVLTNGLIRLYFSIVVLTGGVLGLSLVNSIFVDSMLSDNNDGLEDEIKKLSEQVAQLRKELEGSKNKGNPQG